MDVPVTGELVMYKLKRLEDTTREVGGVTHALVPSARPAGSAQARVPGRGENPAQP